MPVLFFSGGIDSTTLAFDVARNPWSYGLERKAPLQLVHAGTPAKDKLADLEKIVKALCAVSELDIEFGCLDDGHLMVSPGATVPREGGPESLTPIIHRDTADVGSIVYTPGWMLWMAAVAVNRLAGESHQYGAYNPAQAFIAHQWDGPVWRKIAAGKKLRYDCMPEFFVHAQRAIESTGEKVWLRCPFLENRMDRRMIVQHAETLGVPLHLTSSCLIGWKKNCGLCAPCILRGMAFRSVGRARSGRRLKTRTEE